MFCYRIDATETAADPSDRKLPAGARGTRLMYYYPDAQPHTFADPASFVAGQQVIRDAVEMSFNFSPDRSQVTVTMNVHRVGVEPFVYKGELVHPPERADHTVLLAGGYSPDLGGYLLRNITREGSQAAGAGTGPS